MCWPTSAVDDAGIKALGYNAQAIPKGRVNCDRCWGDLRRDRGPGPSQICPMAKKRKKVKRPKGVIGASDPVNIKALGLVTLRWQAHFRFHSIPETPGETRGFF